MKSGSARDLEQFVTTFYNPEVAAMAAVVDILDGLPDSDARLRVMRWAFAKYTDEFKRPVPATAVSAPPPAAASPAPVTGPVLVVSTPRPMAPAPAKPAVAVAERSVAEDIEEQIAELNDLFPAAAASVDL